MEESARNTQLPKMTMQEKIDNQQILARINRKIDFKKNPRYDTKATLNKYADILVKPETVMLADAQQGPFRSDPPVIQFSNYKKDHVYEFEITLVNTSKVIKRIKLSPLRCEEFTVSQIKYPNKNSGDIAPGMGVKIVIRFHPKQLTEFEDELIVLSEANIFKVPIITKLEEADLNLPGKIDLGNCWIGNQLEKTLQITNSGGDTKFEIRSGNGSEAEASENPQNSIRVGNYVVAPRIFALEKKQKVKLNIKYNPKEENEKNQHLQILCDSGKKFPFSLSGKGFAAELSLLTINGLKVAPPSNPQQQQEPFKVYLNKLYPNHPKTASIVIKNLATVQLKYHWSLCDNLKITQPKDTFKPLEERIFELTYLSNKCEPSTSRISIFLDEVPAESIRSKGKKSKQGESLQFFSFELVKKPEKFTVTIKPQYYLYPQPIFVKTSYTRTFTIVNMHETQIPYTVTNVATSDNCVSKCLNQKGSLKPRASTQVIFSFEITEVTTETKKALYLVEFWNSPAQFIEIQGRAKPPELTLENTMVDFGLLRTNYHSKANLKVQNKSPVSLQFKIQNPHKYFWPHYDDFYVYTVEDEDYLPKRLKIQNEPKQGIFSLQAGQTMQVGLTYHSLNEAETFQQSITLEVLGGTTHKIDLFAQVQHAHLQLSKGYINLKEIFVGNTYNVQRQLRGRTPICLLNLGNIEGDFQWVVPSSEEVKVEISPKKGVIAPKSKQLFDIQLSPLRSCNLNYILTCQSSHLKRQKKSMELQIQAEMKGLEICYYLINEALAKRIKIKEYDDLGKAKSKKITTLTYTSGITSAATLKERQKVVYPNLEKVQFFNCEINKPKQLDISLANLSDLNAEFEVYAQQYNTLQKDAENSKESKLRSTLKATTLLASNQMAFTSEMGKTLMANRALEKSQKLHLSNNKGVSILCEPSRGEIPKNGEIRVKLTLFNDICGRFKDKLIVKVKNHQTKEFPLDIDIKGTPIILSRNQIGMNFAKEYPLYMLGSFPTKSGLAKREFKVINNGPKPVELGWKIYPSNKRVDDKEIFNINFQEPEPGSGNLLKVCWDVIEPEEEKDSQFAVEPKVKMLQSREEAYFTVTFKTAEEASFSKSIFVGEPKLTHGESVQKMEPLTLMVQAQTINPQLSMDVEHKNHLTTFLKMAGQETAQDTSSVILQNLTNTNLIFSVDTSDKMFQIMSTRSNSLNQVASSTLLSSSKTASFRMKTLQPIVQKSFTLEPKTHVQIKMKLMADHKNLEEWPMINKIKKDAKLVISYANGDIQQFGLVGELLRPCVLLNTTGVEGDLGYNVLDFGTVHTKNSKTMTVFLVNNSFVKGKWSLKYTKYPSKKTFQPILWTRLDKQDQTITDEKECFNFSVSEGVLEPLSIPVRRMPTTLALPSPQDEYSKTHVPQKILINFKPKKNVLYKSKYKIAVEDGESLEFVVQGQGTYAEQLEK